MKAHGYIDYPKGTGLRGTYPILINKHEPTKGVAKGWQLQTGSTKDFNNPFYEYNSPTPFREVYGEACSQAWGQHGSEACLRCGVSRRVGVGADGRVGSIYGATFQDIQNLKIAISQESNNPTPQSPSAYGGEGETSFDLEADDNEITTVPFEEIEDELS